ncbi:ArsR/SmtB family transcription factor [Amycolatopsis xylanica]|nr:winged helix-turn-helix domain-containing protein [Amycolatopsis xylanica]
MVLRIVFTRDDLSRVRVAEHPHPLWELVLGINTLQSRTAPDRFQPWRASADAGRIAALAPPGTSFPDFLTPPLDDADIEAHFDAMLRLPKDSVRKDLELTYGSTVPDWAWDAHDTGRLDGLVAGLRDFHDSALAARWPEVRRAVEADRAMRAKQALSTGVDGLLSGLHPSIRWRYPVLEADYLCEHTIHLRGRGLTLVPASFCWGAPVTMVDPEQPPVLVYPCADLVQADTLGRLLGPERARVLTELRVASSATQLAIRLGVPRSTIRAHLAVLHDAGLLTTRRAGPHIRHTLTRLGHSLLGS